MVLAEGAAARLCALEDAAFESLVRRAVTTFDDDQSYGTEQVDDILDALIGLFLASALDDMSPDALLADLMELLPHTRSQSLASLYRDNLAKIRKILHVVTPSIAQVADVSWRRSTVASSRTQQGTLTSLYEITLTTIEDGRKKEIDFTANTEELTCLVSDLKSALKAAETYSQDDRQTMDTL